MNRPKLDKNITLEDFKDYYWLKEELVVFCRGLGINRTGGKLEISYRIEKYLETGEIVTQSSRQIITSKFDWNVSELDSGTLITDNYKCTEHVRGFFKQAIGDHFKFNVPFLKWLKANAGKTLGEAVEEWRDIAEQRKGSNYQTEIAPQFEYNTYIRDFMNDNPALTIRDARNCWNAKRYMPGLRKYTKEDVINLIGLHA